jgi:hypothetical protein
MVSTVDVVAYAVPGFFLFSIGWVLLQEIAAEPYGWSVAGAKIDNGSRVVTLLAPTLLRLFFYFALLVAIVVGIVLGATKNGSKEMRRLWTLVSTGKRLD